MQVRISATGVEYDLGQQLGSIQVLGMADTGVGQDSYDECYQASRNPANSSCANCKQAAVRHSSNYCKKPGLSTGRRSKPQFLAAMLGNILLPLLLLLLRCCAAALLQEDYDNYLDVILDASSPEAAASLTTLMAFQTDEGYSPLYNPGECVCASAFGAAPRCTSLCHAAEVCSAVAGWLRRRPCETWFESTTEIAMPQCRRAGQ